MIIRRDRGHETVKTRKRNGKHKMNLPISFNLKNNFIISFFFLHRSLANMKEALSYMLKYGYIIKSTVISSILVHDHIFTYSVHTLSGGLAQIPLAGSRHKILSECNKTDRRGRGESRMQSSVIRMHRMCPAQTLTINGSPVSSPDSEN